MTLPAPKVVLSSVENKKQLIQILFEELTQDRLFHLQSTRDHGCEDSCPLEVRNEERNTLYDLETYQEVAEIVIVQQVLLCVGEARQTAVVSDDTDVFAAAISLTNGMNGSATYNGIIKQGKGKTSR